MNSDEHVETRLFGNVNGLYYWVATISRLPKITRLFCRIPALLESLSEGSCAKETYNLNKPTNPSHPIRHYVCSCRDPHCAPFMVPPGIPAVRCVVVQPVPEKMRLDMLVEMQIEILDGQSLGLFSNEPFEKRPVMTIEDFVLHSDDHFESHPLGNGL